MFFNWLDVGIARKVIKRQGSSGTLIDRHNECCKKIIKHSLFCVISVCIFIYSLALSRCWLMSLLFCLLCSLCCWICCSSSQLAPSRLPVLPPLHQLNPPYKVYLIQYINRNAYAMPNTKPIRWALWSIPSPSNSVDILKSSKVSGDWLKSYANVAIMMKRSNVSIHLW